jgi:ABC-type antimicrobial peptide transport system permease subunit
MRRFEIGTRMSIGAKKSDIIKLMLKDNIRTFLLGILVSILVILVLLVFFKQTINNVFASSALELVPLYLMSLMFITAIASLSCYLPLRQFVNKPVVYSLKGGE